MAYQGRDLLNSDRVICTRCIYDDSIPGIIFDEKGVCNYCKMVDSFVDEYMTGTKEGIAEFEKIVAKVKKAGRNQKYDVAVGVSGGTDSSYMLFLAKQYGLRPLAVHYDNTWNSAIATENIRKVTKALDVDLFTYVVDNKEMDDIFGSFFRAGVPELDAATDLAFPEIMYRACKKHKIKYSFEGHSFVEEGVSPIGYFYFDGGYIRDIHKKFGKMKMKSYPNMTFMKFLYWTIFLRIKRIRPFWYLPYSKEDAKAFLMKNYGWEYYGGHHLENRITAFHHSYYNPLKFGIDQRNNSLGALVRKGDLTREEAYKIYSEPPYLEPELLEYFKKRLDLSDEEFDRIMKEKPRTHKEFKNYKKLFRLFRPLFFVLYKLNIVYKSFYVKYCVIKN